MDAGAEFVVSPGIEEARSERTVRSRRDLFYSPSAAASIARDWDWPQPGPK
jgi:2-keto-3-deoxy-6-phosphogluconate aldolase